MFLRAAIQRDEACNQPSSFGDEPNCLNMGRSHKANSLWSFPINHNNIVRNHEKRSDHHQLSFYDQSGKIKSAGYQEDGGKSYNDESSESTLKSYIRPLNDFSECYTCEQTQQFNYHSKPIYLQRPMYPMQMGYPVHQAQPLPTGFVQNQF